MFPDRIAYGGDYNPEQWDESVWAEDVALMREAGVNVVTLGVFSWGRLQPDADTWDSGWLHRVVDLLHAGGIAVDMATPTASPPPWLGALHPEVLATDRDGVRMTHGSRNHFCPSSPAYRAASRDIARRLADEFAEHPAVVMWHVGNEYGQQCWCERCEDGFRGWLRERYGSLEALNRDWGTAFWSQHYSDWDHVSLPRRVPYLVNPAQYLDLKRFVSWQQLDCYRDQRDVLRPLVGEAPVTTNFMGFFDMVDYREFAGSVDVVADDHYGDPADPDQPHRTSLVHDLMRSLRHAPWLMMEQAMGAVNFREHNVPKTSAQRRLDVLRAVARGADGVLSFQWRASRAGSERFHSAMLPHAGTDSALHRDVRALGRELASLGDVVGSHARARVALVFDWESMWAQQEPSVPSRRLRTLPMLEAWYRPLWERGVAVDVVASTEDLSGYQLILLPAQHLLRDEAIAGLRRAVEAGTHVVMGPFSGVVDEHTTVRPGPFPAGLTDLLGAGCEQWWPLPESGVGVRSSLFGDARTMLWTEQLTVGDADVLARFDHPDLGAAIVRRENLTYVACDLPTDALDAVLADVLSRADVAADLGPLRETGGAEVVVRGPFTFVLNHQDHEVVLPLNHPVRDIATGRRLDDVVVVGPTDARILRKDA